ncbi:DUF6078 family protein [Bacteroides reticulotermitis]|uniref:Uncharacterized protein n=2 Tax=Bacteroides reticulotermitis TaxID=1133319 RepID=W4UVL4_9BACE|nr:DUF6078 family protein [Bacteroides reticulotermitis]MBB4042755.1 hypothetical protein [Bacteroides reticulotermitis]GAE85275.1 hypothetical protein JCM10512_3692 [Bacteroides reticulotermitis JCM 10512]HJD74693.1 DUF6078 family protein [Bacteroides reticulotermitis]
MLSDFNYQSVPYGFSHCLNGQCKHATECLHYQVALHVPTECRSFTLINPAYTTSDNGDCPCFTSDQPLRFARGITHLLDNMTHSNALAVKQKMLAHFGRNTFYRINRKERAISPSEQQYIRQIFKDKGLDTEPVYDEYIKGYDW